MRVEPKSRRGFLCRRRLWTLCFLAGALVSVVVPACKANSVYDADLYVADNEEDAEDTLSTSLSVCDCNYWVRVRWRAGEWSPNPPDSRDNPFDIEIWQPGATHGDGTKIWSQYGIADVDPAWQQKVGKVTHSSALAAGTHEIRAYVHRVGTDDWERSNKCTVTVYGSCTQAYKYAWSQKHVSDLIGISSTIKTRYGALCCEGFEDEGTFSAAACHVVKEPNDPNNPMHWAEMGYERKRWGGSTQIKTYLYVRMHGDTSHSNYDDANAPGEGSSHSYNCELDKSTGKWTFYYDGSYYIDFTDTYWQSNMGGQAVWQGEIYHTENDMAGTSGNKCNFTNCQYKQDGGSYQSAGLNAGDLHSSDSSEWGAEYVNVGAFNIWDKDPLW